MWSKLPSGPGATGGRTKPGQGGAEGHIPSPLGTSLPTASATYMRSSLGPGPMLPGGRAMVTVSGSLNRPVSGLWGNRRNRVPVRGRAIGYMTILPRERVEESCLIGIPETERKIYKRNGHSHSETLFEVPDGEPRPLELAERVYGRRSRLLPKRRSVRRQRREISAQSQKIRDRLAER